MKLYFCSPPPPFKGEAPGSSVDWYGFKLALGTTSVKRWNFQATLKGNWNTVIHKENPTRCNNVSKFIIPYLYEVQHVSGDTPPIIRNLKLHCQPLVFHKWKIVGRVAGGRCHAQCAWQGPPATRLTTFHVWKTRGCQCSFRLLMMRGVSSETCWALCKYGIRNFNTLLHPVGFSLWIVLWRTDPRRWNTVLTKGVRIGIVTHKINS